MRNLATLNQLLDGVAIATERRTTESFTVRGARLTIALQVQEATLRSFFDRSGGLAGKGYDGISRPVPARLAGINTRLPTIYRSTGILARAGPIQSTHRRDSRTGCSH